LLSVPKKEDRLYFEKRLISAVSNCSECQPSANWLGLYSPEEKIRKSGLWQTNELYKEPLSDEELTSISKMLVRNPEDGVELNGE
jgi:hypothetical protein